MEPSQQPDTDRPAAPASPPRTEDARPAAVPIRRLPRWTWPADWRVRSVEGMLLGALLGLGCLTLGITALIHQESQGDVVLLPGLLGMAAALSPARRLLRVAACALAALMLLVGYTPLMSRLLPTVMHSDPLEHAPAIVVLSTSLRKDNTLNAAGQERFVHGYLLLRQGLGPYSRAHSAIPKIGDQSPVVMDQMRTLGLDYPVERDVPVVNTHDEAVLAAQLARRHGWKRVILVTHPWHERRARAVFRKAGLDVICSPCVEGAYSIADLTDPLGRSRPLTTGCTKRSATRSTGFAGGF